jgi:putative SOS response-associated peptidase YedK
MRCASFSGSGRASSTRHPCRQSFLTTTPNAIVKPIHPNRMPVILKREDHDTWLTGTPEQALGLTAPYPADEMQIVYTGETKDEAA